MTDHFSGAVTAPAERAASTQTASLQILLVTRGSKTPDETTDRGEQFEFHWEAEERR